MATIRHRGAASGGVGRSGPLRRAQASFGAMWASESALMVGLAVVRTSPTKRPTLRTPWGAVELHAPVARSTLLPNPYRP
jgi:hypothetical protein